MRLSSPLERLRLTRAIGLPLRVLGLRWTVSDRAATQYALEVGLDPANGDTARLRVARICREIGDRATAVHILEGLPDALGEGPDGLILQADVDWSLGRYEAALRAAERLLELRPGNDYGRRMRDRARAELVPLDPGWRPRLPGGRVTYAHVPGRVLHLLTNSLPYRQAGYTVRAQNVARCQIAVGLEPEMATRPGFPSNEGVHHARRTSVVDGVTYHHILPDLDRTLGTEHVANEFARRGATLVEEFRPAVLQPTTNHVNAQVALALRDRYRVRVVYEVRGFLEETWLSRVGSQVAESDRYVASRAVETACMRAADAIVTLSDTMRQEIIERGGIDPDFVCVVPNAVDIDRFVPGTRPQALARQLDIGDEPVIGYISSFTAYEGILYLIEATAELRRRGRHVRCLLVGDGEARPTLETRAADLGLLDDRSVIFTGRVSHQKILDYYRLIDVFVVPRTTDRVSQLVTPLKPYEAMAMERALVVSAVDALVEIVTDRETGRTFTPEDAADLANVVDSLLDSPDERRRLGTNAREWVATHRTWAMNGQRYRELFERLDVA